MEAGSRAERPLAILGTTASGKSSLALAMAARLGGIELVSIDSMQVYRSMNIGTATPTREEQALVPHHLIDLIEPTESYAVGEFQARALATIDDIRARGRVPVLVGGTGLYLRAITDALEIPGRFAEVMADLDVVNDTAGLHARLVELDPVAAARMEPTNRRRILRALEVTVGSGRPFSSFGPGLESYPSTPFVQVALSWPRRVLDDRISSRYQHQMNAGFLEEVAAIRELGPSRTAACALGYRELIDYLDGQCSLDEALASAIQRTCRFARRQERWFRRDPRIRWLDAPADPEEVVALWDEVRSTPAG